MKTMTTVGNAQSVSPASDASKELSGFSSSTESTIGEMAADFGVSLRTLRFYEDRKLLRPRREGNTRLYSASDRQRMQMILKGKRLGFTLTEISELIGGKSSSDDFEGNLRPAQIATQIDHLERQRRDIDDAITRLRNTHEKLARSGDHGESLAARM